MTRRLVLAIAALILTVASMPVRAADAELEGTYQCEGTNPAGKPYRGITEIRVRGDVVLMRWLVEDEESSGFGFISHGLLVVAITGSNSLTVATYALKPGEPLVGEWLIYGADRPFPETLTKLPADHPTPDALAPPKRVTPDPTKEQRL